ncbi:MAG: hypothetical protein NVS9B12_09230 [Vulcanimicrobiaceae bacterium]
MLSVPHMIVVFVIALVVFGPQKLPELARTLGKLMAEFRKASGDFRSAFEQEMRDIERQTLLNERQKAAAAVAAQSIQPPGTTEPGTGAPRLESAEPLASNGIEGSDRALDPHSPMEPVIAPVPESVPREVSRDVELPFPSDAPIEVASLGANDAVQSGETPEQDTPPAAHVAAPANPVDKAHDASQRS